MTGLAKIGLLTAGVGAPSAAGIYYLIGYVGQPSTLRGRLSHLGKAEIAEGSNAQWRGKFSDYESEIKQKISNITGTETPSEEAIKALARWCKGEGEKGLEGNDYASYEKLCSDSDFRTNRGKLISSGADIASSDDDWKLIYLNHKHSNSFMDKVKSANAGGTETPTDDDKGRELIKKACEKWLAEESPFTNHELARKWCVKSTDTKLQDLLGRANNFQKLGEGDFESADKRWGSDSTYLSAISATSGTSDNKDKLKEYCKKQYEKELKSITTNWDAELKNTYNYCNKSITTGTTLQDITWPA